MATGSKTPGSGRKAGTPNKATQEVKDLAGSIIRDPVYRKNLIARAKAGVLPPAVEVMLFHYFAGAPPKEHTHTGRVALEAIIAGTAVDDDAEDA